MTDSNAPQNGIGTLGEASLHAQLKQWYAQPGDLLEQSVEGYVIDILRGNTLIEIQTRNFAQIRRKLDRLAENHPVRLVYPIALEKWIIRQEAGDGYPISRRKSPRRGRVEDLFRELIRIPHLAAHSNFSLEVLFTRVEEVLCNDGSGSWRRKGWSIIDRRLLEVVHRQVFSSPADYAALLPADLAYPFTTRQLAKTMGVPLWLAQRSAYCLRKMGAIQAVGKKVKSIMYDRLDLFA